MKQLTTTSGIQIFVPYPISCYVYQKRDDHGLCPRFPKPKLEGWFLVLANRETKDLLSLKRVSTLRGKSKEILEFSTRPQIEK